MVTERNRIKAKINYKHLPFKQFLPVFIYLSQDLVATWQLIFHVTPKDKQFTGVTFVDLGGHSIELRWTCN